jgi:hypothetical protein
LISFSISLLCQSSAVIFSYSFFRFEPSSVRDYFDKLCNSVRAALMLLSIFFLSLSLLIVETSILPLSFSSSSSLYSISLFMAAICAG